MRTDPELEALAASACAGDCEATAELFERFAPLVQRLARRHGWLESRDLYEDLVDEAFLRFAELVHEYAPGRGVGIAGYLEKTLPGAVRAAAQRLARPTSHEATPEETRDEPGPADPTAEEAVGHEWLRAALAKLSSRQRYAVIQRRMNGAEFDDIAAVLHSTPGAVRVLIWKAKRRLCEILGEDSLGEG